MKCDNVCLMHLFCRLDSCSRVRILLSTSRHIESLAVRKAPSKLWSDYAGGSSLAADALRENDTFGGGNIVKIECGYNLLKTCSPLPPPPPPHQKKKRKKKKAIFIL